MEEKFYYGELFEIYGGLLTERQKSIFEMHYLMDLSLSEIAEEMGISRQNASDTIRKAKCKLEEIEKLLRVKEREEKLTELAKVIDKETAERIKEIIGK